MRHGLGVVAPAHHLGEHAHRLRVRGVEREDLLEQRLDLDRVITALVAQRLRGLHERWHVADAGGDRRVAHGELDRLRRIDRARDVGGREDPVLDARARATLARDLEREVERLLALGRDREVVRGERLARDDLDVLLVLHLPLDLDAHRGDALEASFDGMALLLALAAAQDHATLREAAERRRAVVE